METFRLTFLSILISVLVLSLSCSGESLTGLGDQIDLVGPTVSITSHNNLDFVGNSILLQGEASDEFGVTRVNVQNLRSGDEWEAHLSENGTRWSLDISGLTDGETEFVVQAHDERGNSSAQSIATLTLTVDTQSPASIISAPILRSKTYLENLWPEEERDFESIGYFQNQSFTLRGNIEENFKLDFVTVDLIDSSGNVAFTRTITNGEALPVSTTGTIWNWAIQVSSNDLSWNGSPLLAEQRYIFSIRTTTQDMSGNLDLKEAQTNESLAFLMVHGEADRPWAEVSSISPGDTVFSGGFVSGNIYDDDGIETLYLAILPLGEDPSPQDYLIWNQESSDLGRSYKIIEHSGSAPKLYTWSIEAPTNPDSYRLHIQGLDLNGLGLTSYQSIDFIVPDIGEPIGVVTSHSDQQEELGDALGSFVFSGYSHDNVSIAKVKLAYLPLGQSGSELEEKSFWDQAELGGFTHEASGIRLWDISESLGESYLDPIQGSAARYRRDWSRVFDIQDDFGSYTDRVLVVYSEDNTGNFSLDRTTLLGDREAPQLEILSPEEDGLTLRSSDSEYFLFSGNWSDNGGAVSTVEVRWLKNDVTRSAAVSGQEWSLSSREFQLESGPQYFEVSATDPYGNRGFAMRYVVVITDTTAPEVVSVLSTSPDGAYKAGTTLSINVSFTENVFVTGTPVLQLNSGANAEAFYSTGTGSNTLVFLYTVGSGENSADLDYSSTSSLLGNISDEASNPAIRTLVSPGDPGSLGESGDLVVDTTNPTAPNISGLTVDSESTFTSENQSFSLSGESGAQLFYTLNNGVSWTEYSSTVTLSEEGTYQLKVKQRDGAGNESSPTEAQSITVDKTAPQAPFINGVFSGTYSSDQSFTLSGENGATLEYSYDGTNWFAYGATVTISSPGTIGLRARQQDRAGNLSPLSEIISITIDKLAPGITGISTTNSDGAYNLGKSISVQVSFDKVVFVSGTPSLLMETGTADRSAVFSKGSGTQSLTFTYEVQNGDESSQLDYAGTNSLGLGAGGAIQDAYGNQADLALPSPGSPGSLAAAAAIVIDTLAPSAPSLEGLSEGSYASAQSFTLSPESGATAFYSLDGGSSWPTYPGSAVNLILENTYTILTKQRDAAGNESSPSAATVVSIDTTAPAAPFVGGISAGAFAETQTFSVTGEPGASLEYSLTGGVSWLPYSAPVSLETNGTYQVMARQTDAAGNGPIASVSIQIIISKQTPTITAINSPTSDGFYKEFGSVTIELELSDVVYVTGAPRIHLNSGGALGSGEEAWANYASGNGSDTLSFQYFISQGENTLDLNYFSPSSLELNGGTINDIVGNPADLSLPASGLSSSSDIVVDTTIPLAPTLDQSISGDSYLGSNQDVSFSGEAGASFEYSLDGGTTWNSGSGQSLTQEGSYQLKGRQTDGAGNRSPETATLAFTIDKTAPASPTINGLVSGTFSLPQNFTIGGEEEATLQYTLGYSGTDEGSVWTTLAPGINTVGFASEGSYTIRARQVDRAGNVGPSGTQYTITLDTTLPVVSSLSGTSGSYNAGSILTISIIFSEPVYVGGSPSLSLNSGQSSSYTLGSGTNTLSFVYQVQSGDNTPELGYTSTNALVLGSGGSIKDQWGNNANLTLPALVAPESLQGTSSIVVDTTAPNAPNITGISSGTTNTNQSFTINGETGASLEYSIDGGTTWNPGSGTSLSVTSASQESFNITARQTDAAGNLSAQASTIALTIDKISPSAPLISGITGGSYDTSQSFQVFGEMGATLEYSTNGGSTWQPYGGSVSLNPGSGSQTDYQVLARQTDNAGNGPTNTASPINLTVDLKDPTIQGYAPLQNTLGVDAQGSITLSFSEPVFRESGNIVIGRVVDSLPLVLSVDQYSEYLSQLQVLGNATDTDNFVDAYRLSTNGVLSGGVPDPSAKYVLEFSRGYSDATLLPIFDTLGYNQRTIAVDSTQISGSGTDTIVITPSGGLPIGIEYYLNISSGAFRDEVGNTYGGISNNSTYRFTTGPVATPVIRINRLSSNGYTGANALTTTFRVDVETPGASLLYSMPSTSTTSDSAADFSDPVASAPVSSYSGPVTLGDGVYDKGWRYFIQAGATKSGLSDSEIAGERAYRTVLRSTNPWFRGSNNSGGPTTAPGFPLRWEDNAVGYIRQGIQNGGNYYFVSWEISEYLHFKNLAGGTMTTVSNPSGYPSGNYEAGPSSYGWGAGANYNVHPGGYRIAAHGSYEGLADRRGATSTWIYRPLGQ